MSGGRGVYVVVSRESVWEWEKCMWWTVGRMSGGRGLYVVVSREECLGVGGVFVVDDRADCLVGGECIW